MFILDNKQDEVKKDMYIQGINIQNSNTTEQDLIQISNVINNVFNKLADKDFYYSYFYDSYKYYEPVHNYFEEKYINKIMSENTSPIKEVIDAIYSNENEYFKEAKVVAIGEDVKNKFAEIEIISLGDSELFNVENMRIDFNDNFQIINSKKVSNKKQVPYTTKALDKESLLSNTNDIFLKEFNKFIGPLKNRKLFEEFSLKLNTDVNIKVEAMLSNLQYEDINKETLLKFFTLSRGSFNNYKIVKYYFDDKDAMANSRYVIKIVNKNKTNSFEILFSRISNKIIKITEL
ncbi:hypothetical protein [Clostridioides sp. ZZV14-6045]|uniref:hypothetical protein n=1 Tax=Clostridioides sp. ZZV14-6045 TaxID=2811489 RepID=UPI001D107FA3